MIPQQFIGSEAQSTYDQAKVVILPIPYEKTTTYRKGCQNGPEAIITASEQLEAYDLELEQEVCQQTGIFTTEAIANTKLNPDLEPEMMMEVVSNRVSELINDGKFVIALGGEHSITAAIVTAYQQQLSQPFTVIQIDAHGDMRHSYSENNGEAYVIFGTRKGFEADFNLQSLNGSNGFILKGIDASDLLGSAVTSAGDINDDGIDDLAVSATGGGQPVTN